MEYSLLQFSRETGCLEITLAVLAPLSLLYVIGYAMRLQANHLTKKNLASGLYMPVIKQGLIMEYICGPLILPITAFICPDKGAKNKGPSFGFSRSLLSSPAAAAAKFLGLFTIGLLYVTSGGLFVMVLFVAVPALVGKLFGL